MAAYEMSSHLKPFGNFFEALHVDIQDSIWMTCLV